MRITASNIVKALAGLPKDQWFEYVNPSTKTKVKIERIAGPEGPIFIKRYSPGDSSGINGAKIVSISEMLIWRVANYINENVPFNIDRILGASYNTRSAFEALLAHTPEFYWCKPGRIELTSSTHKVMEGHKHLLWRPDAPHVNGVMREAPTKQVISELPATVAIYDALTPSLPITDVDIEVQRRHLQIQIALVMIGRQLGFRTWIARNDQGLKYGDKKVGELDGVINTITDEQLMRLTNAAQAAMQIDCIWFRNGKFIPAVIEVEHSTGVTSGLARMTNLFHCLPPMPIRWVIAAPDEDRSKVVREISKPQFSCLKAHFLPYSSIDELYSLCQRRPLNSRAVNEEFLDCFIESYELSQTAYLS